MTTKQTTNLTRLLHGQHTVAHRYALPPTVHVYRVHKYRGCITSDISIGVVQVVTSHPHKSS